MKEYDYGSLPSSGPLFDKPEPVQVVTTDPKRESYARIAPKLSERRQAVYDAINSLGRATAKQIAHYLDVPINEVTGRILELRKAEWITKDGTMTDPDSGNPNTIYRINKQINS